MEHVMAISNYFEQISALNPGRHMVLPPDCRGDGYDVACAKHVDVYAAVLKAAPKGSTVSKIYASGFFCGYSIVVPKADEIVCLTQHSGQHGPWYHEAVYRRAPETKTGYLFVCKLGGHYNRRRATATGLPMGRPDRRNPKYAY